MTSDRPWALQQWKRARLSLAAEEPRLPPTRLGWVGPLITSFPGPGALHDRRSSLAVPRKPSTRRPTRVGVESHRNPRKAGVSEGERGATRRPRSGWHRPPNQFARMQSKLVLLDAYLEEHGKVDSLGGMNFASDASYCSFVSAGNR
jgi:hypothetical protein